jgi:hypothetical protein
MVPIHASYINKKATHDRVRNRYTIVNDGKTITHISFTPKHVYGDQIKLKRNIMTWVEKIEVGKR